MKSEVPEGAALILNNIRVRLGCATPDRYRGSISGKERARLRVDLTTAIPRHQDEIKNFFKEGTRISVEDPFEKRTYEATASLEQESYSDMDDEHSYRFRVEEVDTPLDYSEILIDGESFTVLKHQDEFDEEEGIRVDLLLSVNEDMLNRLMETWYKAPSVSFLRQGVDESPLEGFIIGSFYWSKHLDTFKAVVRIGTTKPEDLPHGGFPSPGIQQSCFRDIRELKARFEALLGLLQDRGTLTAQDSGRLLGEDWTSLVSSERVEAIKRETLRVHDAESFL
jgi:hypothetical protein